MVLCLRRISLDLPLYILLHALLQKIDYHNVCILEAHALAILVYPLRSGVTIQAHLSSAYSIVNMTIIVCFEDFHDIVAPPNVKT